MRSAEEPAGDVIETAPVRDGAFLARERALLDRTLPGLSARVGELPLLEREKEGSGTIAAFREAGGPGLLIPERYGGRGLNPVEAVRLQRAIGALSPSLAVAVTMHSFSIATIVEIAVASEGLEGLLLSAVAEGNHLVASGFAEGRPDQGILSSTMKARRDGSMVRLSGSKKPCSLSASMDMLTASFRLEDDDRLAVAIIPATSEGLSRKPFWGTWVLAGAESHEVILDDVAVEEQLVVFLDEPEAGSNLGEIDARGLVWFELLISASYVGTASGLVERAVSTEKGTASDRIAPALELEGAAAALEGVATALDSGEDPHGLLMRALLVRYAVQDAVTRSASKAVETLGGMAFIGSSEVAYLLAAAHALTLHPPSRAKNWESLAAGLRGAPLVLE